ncbi:GMC oxidoreductase [Alkalihalobacterium alkalinitrilicum]|uniref:GMC oxidoreductase n=1 Tax=Alkalihalobacterium alkalinitrilicum TaxID=427920 RepID=UPI0009956517|nr:GMC oxidoreductase [Alkalihalobacterium alkalinitrilicum]
MEKLPQAIKGIPLGEMEKNDYDVLIVGTGAGGGAVLWRLCEQCKINGVRIGVIEAGDLLFPTNFWNLTKFSMEKYKEMAHQTGRDLPNFSGATQVFALGGKTLFWGGVTPRFHVSELKKWPIALKDLNSYYSIAEQIMHVTHPHTKNLPIKPTILSRLRENDFPEATNIPRALENVTSKNKETPKLFSSIHFLTVALSYRPFDLALKARAVQIFVEKKKMFGVKVISAQKREYFIKAKTVVLSTGTLETPRLLLHSGIQGDAIGHYLTHHSSVRAQGKFSSGITGRESILIPQIKGNPYQLQLYTGKNKVNFVGYGKVGSRYENKITLDSKRIDENGVPHIQVDFSYTESDKKVIKRMCSAIELASSTMGAVLTPIEGESLFLLRPPGDENHEAGTCRMGDQPSTSATDLYGQIHSIPDLYIADNSVLPSIGAANPVLTTVALAIRTADHIIEQLK